MNYYRDLEFLPNICIRHDNYGPCRTVYRQLKLTKFLVLFDL